MPLRFLRTIQENIPEDFTESEQIFVSELLSQLLRAAELYQLSAQHGDSQPLATAHQLSRALAKAFPSRSPEAAGTPLSLLCAEAHCFPLAGMDGQPSQRILDFLSQQESSQRWQSWKDIPAALLYACTGLLSDLYRSEYTHALLPAFLCASLKLDSSLHRLWRSRLFTALTCDAEAKDLAEHGLDKKQRDALLRYANLHRLTAQAGEMERLLPWELPLYLAERQGLKVCDWLLSRYKELRTRHANSVLKLEQIRAAIPSSFSRANKEILNSFLDRLSEQILHCRREEINTPRPLTHAEHELLLDIERAFADVHDEGAYRLLLTGEAEDEYMDEQIQRFLSEHELRGEWRDIPLEWISACECSLSYVDAVGYRFLLPAFLRADFIVDFSIDMSIKLAASSEKIGLDYQLERSRLLTEQQREAVERFMHHRRRDPDYCCEDYLLAWEMSDYLAQEEHQTPQAWLRTRYPDIYNKSSS